LKSPRYGGFDIRLLLGHTRESSFFRLCSCS
jgi:hypothetical protein